MTAVINVFLLLLTVAFLAAAVLYVTMDPIKAIACVAISWYCRKIASRQ